ncbi:DUF2203 domain-containing protein [Melioribacteraceae bacterium 4301-Me]|uniref:DUF2203 domain-containing protein n=1 Tax=Pyranulibacter aquaticus TaxID=3163344 RepID=UPI003599DD39
MNKAEVKYFTPKEARKTLPLVKRIVKDILNNAFQIRTIVDSLGEGAENNYEIQKLSSEINYYMHELEEIGCSYKDWNFTVGLVDFPAIIDNEEVLLCWRSDEDDIKFYHSIEEGYAGRKPIPEKYLK